MMISRRLMLSLACLAGWVGPATAQVTYDPGARPYPVPGGVLQPDETLGTSPSFEIVPNRAYGGAPGVRIVERCQYPDGWNATDFSRDINGIPAGVDHTCTRYQYRVQLRARY